MTCLARGVSGAVPGQVRHVVADRWQDGAYDEVAGSDWDAVLDLTWQPELARSALSALATRAAHWILVSSCSVYADHGTPGHDESAAVVDGWTGRGRRRSRSTAPRRFHVKQRAGTPCRRTGCSSPAPA